MQASRLRSVSLSDITMKRCPTCQSTYTDDSLAFCLQDGARLAPITEPGTSRNSDATLILSEEAARQYSNPPASPSPPPPTQLSGSRGDPTLRMPPTAETVSERPPDTARDAVLIAPAAKTTSPVMIAGLTAIVILLLALVGIGAMLLLRNPTEQPPQSNQAPGNTNSGGQTNTGSERTNTNARSDSSPSATNSNSADRLPLQVSMVASSTRVPMRAFTYGPSHVTDRNLQTAWIEGVPGPGYGEWLRSDFDREVKLNQIIFTPGYFKNASIWKQNNRLAAATFQFSDGSSRRFTFPDRMQEQRLDVGGIRTKSVRLVIDEIYPGSVDSEDTAISELSIDWEP